MRRHSQAILLLYTKVKPPRLLVSGRKNGAAWFSPLRLVLVLVVLCTLIVGFQDIHSFDDDVFNVQLVGVSGAPATAPNVWCIEPKSEEAGVGWLVQMVHGRWLLVHFNDCRPQVHQWHVIHILWAPDRWRKWRRKKTKYKCKNKIRCNSPPSRNWPMITWGKKLAGCEIKGRASVCWLQNTKTKTKTKEGSVCVNYKIQIQRQECNKETIVLSFQCISQFRNCLISKKFPMNLNRSFRQVTMPLFRYIPTFFR